LVGVLAACKCEDECEEREPFHRGMVADWPRDGKRAGLTRMTGGLRLMRIFQGICSQISYLNE
jgi:hypothetical protein